MSVSNSRAWLWRGIDALIFTAGIVSACISLFFYDSPLPAVPAIRRWLCLGVLSVGEIESLGRFDLVCGGFFLGCRMGTELVFVGTRVGGNISSIVRILTSCRSGFVFSISLEGRTGTRPACRRHYTGFFLRLLQAEPFFLLLEVNFGCQREIQETTNTLITLHQLAGEVEAIRARIGRLPGSEGELVELRGKPMPTYYLNYCIHYYRSSPEDYSLSACVNNFWGADWDIFGYILHCYGPTSPRRVRAELF